MSRSFASLEFEIVGLIDPERRADGTVQEFMPQGRYAGAATTPLNPYGAGPFCRISIAQGVRKAGVYVLTVDGVPVYVGKCTDLERQWGDRGYGAIHPSDCFAGGQQTNCRVNNLILEEAKEGAVLELWFHETDNLKWAKRELIIRLNPEWNIQVPS